MTVPDPILERFRLGELSAAEHAALEASLTEADRARLAELAADDAAILERYPPRVMAIAIQDKARARAKRWVVPTIGSAVVLLGAAAALAVAFQPETMAESVDHTLAGETVRAKGHTRVLVYSEADPSSPLADQAALAHGDTVQLGVNVDHDAYGVLVSLDGRGVVTTHWPLDGAEAAPIEPGRTQVLPRAYTLDDAPRFERFLLVTGSEPFPVSDVVEAGRTLAATAHADDGDLDLPDTLQTTDLLVRKVAR